MTSESAQAFIQRIDRISEELSEQGIRVRTLVERAFDAMFASDESAAREVIAGDDEIDDVDLKIERDAVELLADVARSSTEIPLQQLRRILVIVKVNNELERIADCATEVAQRVPRVCVLKIDVPKEFRVMSNSIVAIIRDTSRSVATGDDALAKIVLQSEDIIQSFKSALMRRAEEQIAQGTLTVDRAFSLHEIAAQAERMADHATNIAEQVIYAASGVVVRHQEEGWVEVAPDNGPA